MKKIKKLTSVGVAIALFAFGAGTAFAQNQENDWSNRDYSTSTDDSEYERNWNRGWDENSDKNKDWKNKDHHHDDDNNNDDDDNNGDTDNDGKIIGHLFETGLSNTEEVASTSVPNLVTTHAGVWFHEDGKDMNFWLSAFGDHITSAHFHCGDMGEDGPVVVSLFHASSTNANGEIGRGYLDDDDIASTAEDCDNVIGYSIDDLADFAKAIKEGKIYTNVHSVEYPAGIARGQL